MYNNDYYNLLIQASESNLKNNKKHIKILILIFIAMICILIFDLSISQKTFMVGLWVGGIIIVMVSYIFDIWIATTEYIFTKREILSYKQILSQLSSFNAIQNPITVENGNLSSFQGKE